MIIKAAMKKMQVGNIPTYIFAANRPTFDFRSIGP